MVLSGVGASVSALSSGARRPPALPRSHFSCDLCYAACAWCSFATLQARFYLVQSNQQVWLLGFPLASTMAGAGVCYPQQVGARRQLSNWSCA